MQEHSCGKRKRDDESDDESVDESDDLVLVTVATHHATPRHHSFTNMINAQLNSVDIVTEVLPLQILLDNAEFKILVDKVTSSDENCSTLCWTLMVDVRKSAEYDVCYRDVDSDHFSFYYRNGVKFETGFRKRAREFIEQFVSDYDEQDNDWPLVTSKIERGRIVGKVMIKI